MGLWQVTANCQPSFCRQKVSLEVKRLVVLVSARWLHGCLLGLLITLKYTQLLSYFLNCGCQQFKKYDNTLFVFQVQIVEQTFDIFQRSVADVCVAQRGFDVVVPQEFLDEFEVCPRLVEVSGVAMPQAVKSNVL